MFLIHQGLFTIPVHFLFSLETLCAQYQRSGYKAKHVLSELVANAAKEKNLDAAMYLEDFAGTAAVDDSSRR